MFDYEELFEDYIVRYSYNEASNENEVDFEVERNGNIVSRGWSVIWPGYDSVAHYIVACCTDL